MFQRDAAALGLERGVGDEAEDVAVLSTGETHGLRVFEAASRLPLCGVALTKKMKTRDTPRVDPGRPFWRSNTYKRPVFKNPTVVLDSGRRATFDMAADGHVKKTPSVAAGAVARWPPPPRCDAAAGVATVAGAGVAGRPPASSTVALEAGPPWT